MDMIELENPVLLLRNGPISSEHQMLRDFLDYKKCINLSDESLKVIDIANESKYTITGVNAARLYAFAHKIPTSCIRKIDVVSIVKNTDEMAELNDIIQILNEVDKVNMDVYIANNSDAPMDYRRKTYITLQSKVEHLFYNELCEKPYTDETGRVLNSLYVTDYKF